APADAGVDQQRAAVRELDQHGISEAHLEEGEGQPPPERIGLRTDRRGRRLRQEIGLRDAAGKQGREDGRAPRPERHYRSPGPNFRGITARSVSTSSKSAVS